MRPLNFHGYSDVNAGGHYNNDITPDEVVYRGYFGVPDTLYRVDPSDTVGFWPGPQ